ncbi:DUF1566 domain-containing protein [Piscinibacter sakaiensis]|uniref:Lcl domain-containing protein n=1 Tax=Piscinibacter sakaiensis TaxID=1547922 RepID=UPI003AACAE8E
MTALSRADQTLSSTMKKHCAILMAACSIATTAKADLLGRDINGAAVAGSDASAVFLYDSVLDITWARNANINGLMSWVDAAAWADDLTVGSFSDWRLPSVGPVNGSTFNNSFSNNGSTDNGTAAAGTGWGTASEMGHLFYVSLGNQGQCIPGANGSFNSCVPQQGRTLNPGDFQNLQTSRPYWSGTPFNANTAWAFNVNSGFQSPAQKTTEYFAMAVRSGDVISAVPEPETYALMLMGLGVLVVAQRRRSSY